MKEKVNCFATIYSKGKTVLNCNITVSLNNFLGYLKGFDNGSKIITPSGKYEVKDGEIFHSDFIAA